MLRENELGVDQRSFAFLCSFLSGMTSVLFKDILKSQQDTYRHVEHTIQCNSTSKVFFAVF
jgi:hypothetical protein